MEKLGRLKLIKINKWEVHGFDWANVAMRIPMGSYDRADNWGNKDMKLATSLFKSGPDHRKFIRMIDCWINITAPRYWWAQFDTYRFGVDKVSSSTMHTITKRKLTIDDFVYNTESLSGIYASMNEINTLIDFYNDKEIQGYQRTAIFEAIKQLLPDAYIQERIVKCSYEALAKMYYERNTHRLSEWKEFCDWILELPMMKEFMDVK